MATKQDLVQINKVAQHEHRAHSIDPAMLAALPDDGKNYLATGLLAEAGNCWHFRFQLPGGEVDLTLTQEERDQYGI